MAACRAAALLFVPVLVFSAETIAIVGAAVVDGASAGPVQATVLIRGDRIVTVGTDVEVPAGARVVRAEGHTLIPGLFDLHTHLPYAAVNGLTGDWGKNLKAYLYCGVTSVVDFGTYPETFEPMRRLLAGGLLPGPRLSLAARITTPGGHGAEAGRGDFFSLEVLTPREARAAIRRVLPYKPDVIKAFTDGWRYGTAPNMTSMDRQTLAALVEEAHQHGIPVLSHTVTVERAKDAAWAGVDVIAHGLGNVPADDELVRLMKVKGVTCAPTLAVYEPRPRNTLTPLLSVLLEPLALARIPPPATPAASPEGPRQRRWKTLLDNTAALRAGGVRFSAGTDAGVTGTYHGWATLRELELLAAAGLTPLEAINAATGNAAAALHLEDRGTIAPGKLADLVLIEGEPWRDIADIQRVRRVFLGGREIDREQFARDITSHAPTPLPALPAARLIDDFERPDGRSRLDTLWVNSTDAGHDHTQMLFTRTLREPGNHALSVLARMAEKDQPHARINVPLSPGAVEPVDASRYRGVQFEARGDGEYRLVVPTRSVRDSAHYQAIFQASPRWQKIRIGFDALAQPRTRTPAPWTGKDLLMLTFEIARPAGQSAWLELDNLEFR